MAPKESRERAPEGQNDYHRAANCNRKGVQILLWMNCVPSCRAAAIEYASSKKSIVALGMQLGYRFSGKVSPAQDPRSAQSHGLSPPSHATANPAPPLMPHTAPPCPSAGSCSPDRIHWSFKARSSRPSIAPTFLSSSDTQRQTITHHPPIAFPTRPSTILIFFLLRQSLHPGSRLPGSSL